MKPLFIVSLASVFYLVGCTSQEDASQSTPIPVVQATTIPTPGPSDRAGDSDLKTAIIGTWEHKMPNGTVIWRYLNDGRCAVASQFGADNNPSVMKGTYRTTDSKTVEVIFTESSQGNMAKPETKLQTMRIQGKTMWILEQGKWVDYVFSP